jgi:hypothetical protein
MGEGGVLNYFRYGNDVGTKEARFACAGQMAGAVSVGAVATSDDGAEAGNGQASNSGDGGQARGQGGGGALLRHA